MLRQFHSSDSFGNYNDAVGLLFDKLNNAIFIFNCFVTKLLAVSELPEKKQNI